MSLVRRRRNVFSCKHNSHLNERNSQKHFLINSVRLIITIEQQAGPVRDYLFLSSFFSICFRSFVVKNKTKYVHACTDACGRYKTKFLVGVTMFLLSCTTVNVKC